MRSKKERASDIAAWCWFEIELLFLRTKLRYLKLKRRVQKKRGKLVPPSDSSDYLKSIADRD